MSNLKTPIYVHTLKKYFLDLYSEVHIETPHLACCCSHRATVKFQSRMLHTYAWSIIDLMALASL